MAYVVPETFQPCKGARKELPPGLKELATLSEVQISRNVNFFELFLCCTPRQASFTVSTCTASPEEIFSIKESGMCMFRECLGGARNLMLRMSNNEDEDVAFFSRSMTCTRGCCGSSCCPPNMGINSPPYIRIGTIQERVNCCYPRFDAINYKDNENLLTYHTDCCYIKTCGLCYDLEITVHDSCTEECVAKIVKKSKSDCREWCNLKNDFIIYYLTDLDIVKRLMVIGACLLADFNNFEHDRRYCC